MDSTWKVELIQGLLKKGRSFPSEASAHARSLQTWSLGASALAGTIKSFYLSTELEIVGVSPQPPWKCRLLVYNPEWGGNRRAPNLSMAKQLRPQTLEEWKQTSHFLNLWGNPCFLHRLFHFQFKMWYLRSLWSTGFSMIRLIIGSCPHRVHLYLVSSYSNLKDLVKLASRRNFGGSRTR